MTAPLAPCPWCAGPPSWFSQPQPHEAPPRRALGCANRFCPVQPRTRYRETAEYVPQVGYRAVDRDRVAEAEWNARTSLPPTEESSP